MKALEEDSPCSLQDFDEDVVVNIVYKVRHFMMSKVEPVQFGLQVGASKLSELLLVGHGDSPGETE